MVSITMTSAGNADSVRALTKTHFVFVKNARSGSRRKNSKTNEGICTSTARLVGMANASEMTSYARDDKYPGDDEFEFTEFTNA